MIFVLFYLQVFLITIYQYYVQNAESYSAFVSNQYYLLLYNGNLDDDDVDVKTRVGGSILDCGSWRCFWFGVIIKLYT